MKLEKKSTKSLKSKAWTLCSEFIRRREADSDGYTRCYTCNVKKHWKEMQAGHFIHGHTKATFFMPTNIHVQCPRCNTYLSGNLAVYTLRMINEHGKEFVEELMKLSKKEHVHNRKEIIAWINKYTDKLKDTN